MSAFRGVLVPGRNCWRVEPARRVAFLRDGEDYFRAAAEAMARAHRSIVLLAWDVDSHVEVNRHGIEGLPARLGEFLEALVRRRPRLRVRILSWDFSALFALEREALPTLRLDGAGHERIHLHLDDRHPVGASHHQKLLIVDDAIAFSGGLDLTRQRWDTTEHVPGDPRRRDHSRPGGYAPFHDVQALVDGPCAAALAELARRRWRLATGERIPRARATGDPWPPGVAPALLGARVGIARTLPAFEGDPPVEECLRLFEDEIAAARGALYVENQYFTSRAVVAELEASLRRPEGPEILIVLPRASSGWLEEATMGQLRSHAVQRLRAADHAGRLRVVHPGGPEIGDARINVHSKVLVADDVHARVGSANMSNRSMGFDSECDLAIDAEDAATRRGIARFRAELLGEHLGLSAEEVEERLAGVSGSLVRLVDESAAWPRALVPLPADPPAWLDALQPAIELADPARPARAALPRRPPPRRLKARLAALAALVTALSLAWAATPLQRLLDPRRLAALIPETDPTPGALLVALGAHAAAGVLAVPVVLMILATMLAFGPWWGGALAIAGCLCNAATGYGAGRFLGRGIESFLSARFPLVTALLRRHGIASVALVRFLPVAPFAATSWAAGILRIRFRSYMTGTLVGVLPGILLLAAMGGSVRDFAARPGAESAAVLGAAAAAGIAGALYLRSRAKRLAAAEGTS